MNPSKDPQIAPRLAAEHLAANPYTADTRMCPAITYRLRPPQTEICVICGYLYFFAFIRGDSVPARDLRMILIFSRSFASIRGLFELS